MSIRDASAPVFPVSEQDKPARRRAVFSRDVFGLESHHAQSPDEIGRVKARRRRGGDDSMQLIDDLTNRPLDVLYSDSRLARKPDSPLAYWATRIVVFLICIAVGISSAAFVRLLQSDPRKEVRQTLASQLSENNAKVKDLEGQVSRLESQVKAEKDKKTDDSAIASVRADDMAAGLLAVEGPGIALTLEEPVDASGAVKRVVTDTDLQQWVNLAWQAGAEAVAVNGVRIGTQTSIRTAGSQILVGTTPIETPFKIQAIGDKNGMADFLGEKNLPSLYSSYEQMGVYPTITKSNSMKLSGASSTTPVYAQKGE